MPKDQLALELRITSDPRMLGTGEVFSHEILRHTALPKLAAEGLRALIVAALREFFASSYPESEDGPIVISSSQGAGCLTVTIRDYGPPQDVQELEALLAAPSPGKPRRMHGLNWAHRADEVHWKSYGPDGKALCITKWLHEKHVTEAEETLQRFAEQPPLAPAQAYEIRRMQPEEAVQVSQLIYKAYGPSYFNRDVYYPDRVAALNAHGEVSSFVAVDAAGRLVGHYALEFNQDGPVAEGGQAVVDPAHRGRHLLDRLKEAAMAAAREKGLEGMYADAVTVHVFTQKSNIQHGARPTCANLGIAPQKECFKAIAATQAQRVSCLMYFLRLRDPEPRTLHAPLRHQEALAKIYAGLGWPVTFAPDAVTSELHGEVTVKFDSGAARAMLRAGRIGRDTAAALRHAKRELIEHSHAEVLFAELPLNQPGTPALVESLEADGFSFAGLAPHFSADGDLLRMVYLTDDLQREPIQTAEEFGAWLVDYAFADRQRVMAM